MQRLLHMSHKLATHPDIRMMSVVQGLLRREPAAAIEAIKRMPSLAGPVWGKLRSGPIRTPMQAEAGASREPDILTVVVAGHYGLP